MTTIIDTDSHIVEPPDAFTARMSQKWGDLIPHISTDDGGDSEGWYIGDNRVADAGIAVIVRDENEDPVRTDGFCVLPKRFEMIHPSAYDAAERIKVMDRSGIRAAALYPNLPLLFTPHVPGFVEFDIAQYRLECVQAYNDFVADWASVAPERFLTMASIPYWDVGAAAKEVERCAELGFKGVVMTGVPQAHGQPYLVDRHWDPLWSAAQACRMPVSFHVGTGNLGLAKEPERVALDTPQIAITRMVVEMFFENGMVLTDLLFSGVLARFPDLKFVMVESGIGWIPFCLTASDYHFKKCDVRDTRPELEMLPSEYFHRQVYANYWFEELGPSDLEQVGVGNILFETDYPHPTCLMAEEVAPTIAAGLAGVDDNVRDAILWKNAAELYGLSIGGATA